MTLNSVIEYYRNYIIGGAIIALGIDMVSESSNGGQRYGVDFDSLPGVPSVGFVLFFGILYVGMGLMLCFWNAVIALSRLRDDRRAGNTRSLTARLIAHAAVYLGLLIPAGFTSIMVELIRRSFPS